jgi:hypothetical protein
VSTNLTERVSVIENAVAQLTESMREWRREDRKDREQLAAEMKSLHAELRDRAGPTDWKAVGGAVLMTASIMSALMAGANFWFEAKASTTENKVARIEQQLKDQSPEVLRYRVDELERKLRIDNPRN